MSSEEKKILQVIRTDIISRIQSVSGTPVDDLAAQADIKVLQSEAVEIQVGFTKFQPPGMDFIFFSPLKIRNTSSAGETKSPEPHFAKESIAGEVSTGYLQVQTVFIPDEELVGQAKTVIGTQIPVNIYFMLGNSWFRK